MPRSNAIGSLVLATAVLLAGTATARGDSRPLSRCRLSFTREAERYADKRRDLIQRCAERLLACEVALERNGTDPTDCRNAAQLWCAYSLAVDSSGRLGRAIVWFEGHAAAYCGPVDFADVLGNGAGQLWYANDADCGASANLASLITCVRGRLEQRIDESFGDTFPRAGLLLESAGLGGDFANVPRPAITSVSVAATAPTSGTLVSPGTIATATGNAVRFSGDASTLPCGGGTNGDLKVTILTLGAACTDGGSIREQFTLHEPYGADRGGLAGPFSADATYCLELDDGSCDDTVTGTIDVP